MRLLRRGKTVNSAPWRLHFAGNAGNVGGGEASTPIARFSVIVAKRHAKSAVTRNRLRRQLREAFRQEYRQTLPAADFLLRSVANVSMQHGWETRAHCRRLLTAAVARRPLK